MADAMLAESHRRQFDGEDWQYVAASLSDGNYDEYKRLSSEPYEGCECGFCKSAAWDDE